MDITCDVADAAHPLLMNKHTNLLPFLDGKSDVAQLLLFSYEYVYRVFSEFEISICLVYRAILASLFYGIFAAVTAAACYFRDQSGHRNTRTVFVRECNGVAGINCKTRQLWRAIRAGCGDRASAGLDQNPWSGAMERSLEAENLLALECPNKRQIPPILAVFKLLKYADSIVDLPTRRHKLIYFRFPFGIMLSIAQSPIRGRSL